MKLQNAIGEKKLPATRVIGISPDAVNKVKDLADKVAAKTGAAFSGVTLLSDADHKTIDAYGLLNMEAAQRGRFLPHPATFVLDTKGVVRWRFIEKDYKVRPTNDMILEALVAVK